MQKGVVIVVSVIVAAALIGGAVFLQRSRNSQESGGNNALTSPNASSNTPPPPQRPFTAEQLAEFDGVNGSKCYVAVNGTVYEIEQGRYWNNGQHDTSEGKAHCGVDLSEVITQSPHGTSKLEQLTVVGTFTE